MGFPPPPSIFSAGTVSVRTVPLYIRRRPFHRSEKAQEKTTFSLLEAHPPPPGLGLLLPLRPPIRDPIHAADGKMEGGGGVMSKHSKNLADENARCSTPFLPSLHIPLCHLIFSLLHSPSPLFPIHHPLLLLLLYPPSLVLSNNFSGSSNNGSINSSRNEKRRKAFTRSSLPTPRGRRRRGFKMSSSS